MVVNEVHRWEAPGTLELVRRFANTGMPPAGRGRDRLLELRADPARWAATFPALARPTRAQAAELVELRDGLLRLLAAPPTQEDAAWLSGWFERTGLGVRVTVEDGALAIGHASPASSGLAGAVVEAVAAAVAGGTWSRLRRCPDCKLVFWDRTRNASKIWCGMYAGADGRACGSIAKVRRYRARRAATRPGPPVRRPGGARPA
jgi:predicted RNA-binding Zn ribbon-like protein